MNCYVNLILICIDLLKTVLVINLKLNGAKFVKENDLKCRILVLDFTYLSSWIFGTRGKTFFVPESHVSCLKIK